MPALDKEHVVSTCHADWRVFSVGLTGDFRVLEHLRGRRQLMHRVQQLVIERAEDGGHTATWRTFASATTAQEAVDAMHAAQVMYANGIHIRRRRG